MTLNLLFVDLETTGLDPSKCHILECAAVLVSGRADCAVIDSLVDVEIDPGMAMHWESVAKEMHEKNGLLAAWGTGPRLTLQQVEDALLKALEPYPKRSVILAGNTIHFDRRFIQRDMPRLDAALHYRHMDVSVLMTFFEECAGMPRTPANAHRAMADVLVSLSAYRRFEKWTRVAAANFGGNKEER